MVVEITAKGRGSRRERSVAAAKRKVKPHQSYFIRRCGSWFRLGAHGYTGDIAQAGVFLGKDAAGYLDAEGVSLVDVRSMREILWKGAQEQLAAAARLSELALM